MAASASEPPLQLKAAATAPDTQALISSKAWKVKLQQRGLYTGGKVRQPAAGPIPMVVALGLG